MLRCIVLCVCVYVCVCVCVVKRLAVSYSIPTPKTCFQKTVTDFHFLVKGEKKSDFITTSLLRGKLGYGHRAGVLYLPAQEEKGVGGGETIKKLQ